MSETEKEIFFHLSVMFEKMTDASLSKIEIEMGGGTIKFEPKPKRQFALVKETFGANTFDDVDPGTMTNLWFEWLWENDLGNVIKTRPSVPWQTREKVLAEFIDQGGNVVEKIETSAIGVTAFSFGYNSRDRITRVERVVETTAGETITNTGDYAYDCRGLRVKKTEDGETEFYLYSGDNILAVMDEDGVIKTEYVGTSAQIDYALP